MASPYCRMLAARRVGLKVPSALLCVPVSGGALRACTNAGRSNATVVNVRSAARVSEHSVQFKVYRDDEHRHARLARAVAAAIGQTHPDARHGVELMHPRTDKPIKSNRQLDAALTHMSYEPCGAWLEYRVRPERQAQAIPEYVESPVSRMADVQQHLRSAASQGDKAAAAAEALGVAAFAKVICEEVGRVAADVDDGEQLRGAIGKVLAANKPSIARLGFQNAGSMASMIATDLHNDISAAASITPLRVGVDRSRAFGTFAQRSKVWSALEAHRQTRDIGHQQQQKQQSQCLLWDNDTSAATTTETGRGRYFMPAQPVRINLINVDDDQLSTKMQTACPHTTLGYQIIGADQCMRCQPNEPCPAHATDAAAATADIGTHRGHGHHKKKHHGHHHSGGLLHALVGEEQQPIGCDACKAGRYCPKHGTHPHHHVPHLHSLLPFGEERDADLRRLEPAAHERIGAARDTELIPFAQEQKRVGAARDTELIPLAQEQPRAGTRERLLPLRTPESLSPLDKIAGPLERLLPLDVTSSPFEHILALDKPKTGSHGDTWRSEDGSHIHYGIEWSMMTLYNRLETADGKPVDPAFIVVDDQPAERIKYGQFKDIPVQVGKHTVSVRDASGTVIVPARDYPFTSKSRYPCIMMPGQKRLFVTGIFFPRLVTSELQSMVGAGHARVLAQTSPGIRVAMVDSETGAEHVLSDNEALRVPARASTLRIYANGDSGDKPSPIALAPGASYTVAAGRNADDRVWTHVMVEEHAPSIAPAAEIGQAAAAASADDGGQFNFLRNKK